MKLYAGQLTPPGTPSTIDSTSDFKRTLAHSSSFGLLSPASLEETCLGISTQEISRLHGEAAMLRVECSGLAERHWQLCSEIDSTVDEMRGHLRIAARASGDRKLSLDQATKIGRWFLDVIERLRTLTTFMQKHDLQAAGSTPSLPRVSMARVCSPGPRRGG